MHDDAIPRSDGIHCETTALGVLLDHAGLRLSEPMRFGLGAGLSFIYWDSKRQDFPFLGGRVKPFALTRTLTDYLGIALHVQETGSAAKAWHHAAAAIDRGVPVGLQLDSHDLEYFTTRVHFAGHMVAMYDYDDTRAYLVDTVQQGGRVATSLSSLARARAARGPMSARHRSFTVDVPTGTDPVPALVSAITSCAEAFLDPPIANLGNRGIRTAANRITTWLDRIAEPGRDLPVIATLMERAGTGGALFRNLYRDFLAECRELLPSRHADRLTRARDGFAASARHWTEVAGLIEQAGTTLNPDRLTEAGRLLDRIAATETAAMATLRGLRLPGPGPPGRRKRCSYTVRHASCRRPLLGGLLRKIDRSPAHGPAPADAQGRRQHPGPRRRRLVQAAELDDPAVHAQGRRRTVDGHQQQVR